MIQYETPSKELGKEINFLDLRKSNAEVEDALARAAERVIRSGRYLHGDETKAFEHDLSTLCGGGSAVGCSNGLDAIRLILRGYIECGKLSNGDEIIVPANTYIASILPISEFGLRPVLCEPSSVTMNLDFNEARKLVTERTKAVMLVHLYGSPCWDADFGREMREKGILLIEDNAQAIDALASSPGLHGVCNTGLLGDAAAFSFYPTKNIGALGDAGAVLTNDESLASAVRALANYGSDIRYHNIYRGYNCRMDELQAAMLRVQLARIGSITARRRETAAIYDKEIQHPDVIKPRVFPDEKQVWHQYVVRVNKRDEFRRLLSEKGISTDIHYATPPHLQPCYRNEISHHLPVTEKMADTVVSIPVADVSADDAKYIADTINQLPSV